MEVTSESPVMEANAEGRQAPLGTEELGLSGTPGWVLLREPGGRLTSWKKQKAREVMQRRTRTT